MGRPSCIWFMTPGEVRRATPCQMCFVLVCCWWSKSRAKIGQMVDIWLAQDRSDVVFPLFVVDDDKNNLIILQLHQTDENWDPRGTVSLAVCSELV